MWRSSRIPTRYGRHAVFAQGGELTACFMFGELCFQRMWTKCTCKLLWSSFTTKKRPSPYSVAGAVWKWQCYSRASQSVGREHILAYACREHAVAYCNAEAGCFLSRLAVIRCCRWLCSKVSLFLEAFWLNIFVLICGPNITFGSLSFNQYCYDR